MDCNPYLGIAASLACGLLGIKKKLKPREKGPVSVEAGKMKGVKGKGFKDKSSIGRIKPGTQPEENRESPINLMTLINSKLPQTVLRNMGAPD